MLAENEKYIVLKEYKLNRNYISSSIIMHNNYIYVDTMITDAKYGVKVIDYVTFKQKYIINIRDKRAFSLCV
jgi:hypothetical protein